jgi:CheY-like chemotaxis protein
LYVGSDVPLLTGLRRLLSLPQYQIISCPDRGSAILFLQGDARYDLLMLELELSGAGVELVQLVRSLPHRQHLPIVIVTTNEEMEDRERLAPHWAADEWVTKQDLAAASQSISRLLESEARRTL